MTLLLKSELPYLYELQEKKYQNVWRGTYNDL